MENACIHFEEMIFDALQGEVASEVMEYETKMTDKQITSVPVVRIWFNFMSQYADGIWGKEAEYIDGR